MTNEEWAKELKKNTQVMLKTFEASGLELLNYSYMLDGDTLHCLVEVSSVEDDPETDSFDIKLNLYDSDGDIYAVREESAYEFTGYDTFDIWTRSFSKVRDRIKKARLYVNKG